MIYEFYYNFTIKIFNNKLGITALIALGILDALQEQGKIPNLNFLEHNSTQYLHALVESLRLAFADTRYYVTDPDVHHVPINELLLSKVNWFLIQ